MAMRKEYRPFNMEQAKAGAPYGCLYDEVECEILRYDTAIFGIYRHKNGSEYDVCKWSTSGDLSSIARNVHDLVMIPLFHLQSKPIYMGDTLYDANGSAFQVELSHTQSMIEECSWEAPKAKIETRMSKDDLLNFLATTKPVADDLTQLANAVIARAIEDGDVFTFEKMANVASLIAKRPVAYEEVQQMIEYLERNK